MTMFDEHQYDKIADILINLGTLFFGAIVVPFLFGIDKIASEQVLFGIILSISFWLVAITVVSQKKL